MSREENITTRIWMEEAAADNPYAAQHSFCSGYDVYGDLLGNLSWVEYLYLLFRLELPEKYQARALELIAVAIAHPGIRDLSVRAAMNAGVGGSTRASALMAALAVGAGNYGGGREVVQVYRLVDRLGRDRGKWQEWIAAPSQEDPVDTWLPMEHVPGFDPNGATCPLPVVQTLEKLVSLLPDGQLAWMQQNREALEEYIGYPFAMSGVIAVALMDLGFDEGQAEMLYLMLRLPGAAAQALEQEALGWRKYPFFGKDLKPMPNDEYQQWLKTLG